MLQVCPRKEANASHGLPPRTMESVNCLSFFIPFLLKMPGITHSSHLQSTRQLLKMHTHRCPGRALRGILENYCHSIFKLFKLATSQGAAHSYPATFPSIKQAWKPWTSSLNHGTQCQTSTANSIVEDPNRLESPIGTSYFQETYSLLPPHKCQKLLKWPYWSTPKPVESVW